jgi:hypothetical protein
LATGAGVATTGADVVVVAKTGGAFCAVADAIAAWEVANLQEYYLKVLL